MSEGATALPTTHVSSQAKDCPIHLIPAKMAVSVSMELQLILIKDPHCTGSFLILYMNPMEMDSWGRKLQEWLISLFLPMWVIQLGTSVYVDTLTFPKDLNEWYTAKDQAMVYRCAGSVRFMYSGTNGFYFMISIWWLQITKLLPMF